MTTYTIAVRDDIAYLEDGGPLPAARCRDRETAERIVAALERDHAGRTVECAPLTANDWAVLYRLIDQYTEDAYKDLPKDDPSHVTRRAIRERVTCHLIATRTAECDALAASPGASDGAGEATS